MNGICKLAVGFAMLLAAFIANADRAPAPVWIGTVDIARGGGERGPWQQNDSRYDFVDDPSVALDERGDAAVAWVDQARKAVLFQVLAADGSKSPQRPVDVSRQPDTFSWLPRVVKGPDAPGQWFVLWQEIIFSGGTHGGEIMFAATQDGGRSFSPPLNLSNSTGGDGKGRINARVWHNGSLDMAAGRGGMLYAAWTEYEGPLWFSRSTNAGAGFSRPMRIAGGGKAAPARAPSVAVAPDGAVYLAWTLGDRGGADIHLAKSVDGGVTFSPPRVVAPTANYSDAPRLAVDAAGSVHLVYAESAGDPFGRYHVRYARSTDGGRSFRAHGEISSPQPGPFASASYPALGIDRRGRVYVLWELYREGEQQSRGLGMAVSADGGRSFSRPTVVAHSVDAAGGFNGSSQGLLMQKLAVNGAGEIAVVNSSLKHGSHSRVWLTRGQGHPETRDPPLRRRRQANRCCRQPTSNSSGSASSSISSIACTSTRAASDTETPRS